MRPERPEFQPQAVLRTLIAHGVDFVVVGGLAAMAHGSAYPSFDVDIVHGHDAPNLERLTTAVRELDAKTLEAGTDSMFATPYGSLHVIGRPAGAPSYDELKRAAFPINIEGEPVLVASLDHLIAMKRATGRPHDQTVVAELQAISDELRA